MNRFAKAVPGVGRRMKSPAQTAALAGNSVHFERPDPSSFRGHTVLEAFGMPSAHCRAATSQRTPSCARHEFALTVDRDHVVAVVEDETFNLAGHFFLDVRDVRQACHVIFARVNNEGRRTDLG